jgi:hypothetical protein
MNERNDWRQLIAEGVKAAKKDPRELFVEALAGAHAELEREFKKSGRKLEIEKAGGSNELGKAIVKITHGLTTELRVAVNVTTDDVWYEVSRGGIATQLKGGKPSDYSSGTVQNVIAFLYNRSVTNRDFEQIEPHRFA